MRNLKKFLALVLAMMMTLSLMVVANAKDVVTEFSDTETIVDEFYEDVTVLAGMGIIKGYDDGTFKPQKTITRAEMTALVYRLATGDAKDESNDLQKYYVNFKDVSSDSWYAGYVGYCQNAEIIKGVGNGYFSPKRDVTGYEALAMILRAVGYDANGEFTGTGWQTRVGQIATQRGILDNINNTNYGATLSKAATRELVAEMLFQAALIDRVKYTPAYGYQTGDHTTGNPITDHYNEYTSLGYLYYGLTDGGTVDAPRVILGNKATGEGGTLLGNNKSVPYTDTNGQVRYLDVSYAYPGSQVQMTAVTPNMAAAVNVGDGLKVDAKTGLDMFGHKVTVWYDGRSNATWHHTYAVFDRATHTATVQSLNTAKSDADPIISGGTNGLGIQAKLAGFTVDLNSSKVWTSDRYSRIVGDNGGVQPAAGSTKRATADATDDTNGIYSLISNSADKSLDVVVTLRGEVGIIAQKDTTATNQTLTVGSTDQAITNKSTFAGANATAGIFAINSLTEESTQTLGDKVTAWQVIGTNNATTYPAWAAATGNVGTYRNGNVDANNYNRYDLKKLETTVSGTVMTYGADHSITMTDGTVYQQSWFRWLPDGGRVTDAVIGTNDGTEPFTVPTPFQAGVTYTIALDEFGNWLGAVAARDQFIYGTFGDYGFGELGSGTIGYTLTGVNWDGEKVINHKIISMNLNNGTVPYFNGNTVANHELADGHNNDTYYTVTKKFLGTTSGSEGNQIKAGKDTGFVVSSEGALTDNLAGYAQKMPATTWSITAGDVANGFADLAKDGTYLATPNTKFIVVSGTGTDTLDVKIYDGMSEFLDGASWVNINGNPGKSNTYFLTEADVYNKYNTTSNKQIAKVIVDARDVTRNTVENLYYAAPTKRTEITGLSLAGNPDPTNIKAYELWNNGVKGTYWVDTDATRAGAGVGSPTAGVAAVDTSGSGDFYRLFQINTVNGVPIYKAVLAVNAPTAMDQAKLNTQASGGICNYNLGYTYVSASELNTGRIGAETFKVNGAVVADLTWNPTVARNEIKSVADLNAAISGGYTLTVAIVNSGVNVSTIYVTNVTP